MRNTKFTYLGSSHLIVFWFRYIYGFLFISVEVAFEKLLLKSDESAHAIVGFVWFHGWAEFVRRKKNFTLNWCSLVARVSCLQTNLHWESSSFSLVYWYLQNNDQRKNSDCQNTALPAIFDFCFRLACAQTFFFSFGKSTSTRPRSRRACDFVCDSDFWFSQGHKRYYDFEFCPVASWNQP